MKSRNFGIVFLMMKLCYMSPLISHLHLDKEKRRQILMPFAVQVHHAFVDGIHIGKLADKLQKYLDEM